jgi:predicted nucleic acid-binding protein
VSGPVYYLDTSAFLKLVVVEKESKALRAALAGAGLWSSTLLDVESHRAARRLAVEPTAVVAALEAVALVSPSDTTFASARDLGPDSLRTLDALHLATAVELGRDLHAVVTYDARLALGCTAVGLAVLQPQ